MALFKQVKCGRCDRTYSSIRGKCPFCGARRGSGKNTGADGENTRWQVIVGAVILLAIIAAAIILISISLKGRTPEGSKATATPSGDMGGVSSIDGTEPTPVPTPSPTPEPTPSPTPIPTPAPVVNSITLNRSDFTLGTIGETFTITATLSPAGTTAEVIWISENTNVCTVDENGTVTAVDHGYTIVSATAGGITRECIVRVSAYAPSGSTGGNTDTGSSTGGSTGSTGSASLSHSDVTIHSGTSEKFTLSVKNAGNETVSYSTSNSSVATVSANGTVTAVSKGTATITVKVGSQTLECIVRVVP